MRWYLQSPGEFVVHALEHAGQLLARRRQVAAALVR